jgi:hypothetical protein
VKPPNFDMKCAHQKMGRHPSNLPNKGLYNDYSLKVNKTLNINNRVSESKCEVKFYITFPKCKVD